MPVYGLRGFVCITSRNQNPTSVIAELVVRTAPASVSQLRPR